MGAPFTGGARTLFDVDLTRFSLGPRSQAAFLAETAEGNANGLTFYRNSVATVRTGLRTVDSTPDVDEACIGCLTGDQTRRGLVMQPRTALCLAATVIPRTHTGWTPGETTGSNGWGGASSQQTNNAAVSPDGQTKAIHVQTYLGSRGAPAYSPAITDGAYGFYANVGAGVSSPASLSAWVKGATQFAMNGGGNPSPPTAMTGAIAKSFADDGDWIRRDLSGVAILQYTTVCDGRDFTAAASPPGVSAAAYDCYVDLINIIRGRSPREAIETAGGVCAKHLLAYETDADDLVALDGQLKFRAIFSPMHDATDEIFWGTNNADLSAGMAWWSYQVAGVKSYARFRTSDRKLVVKIGSMTEEVSTNALTYASSVDRVEIRIYVGGGIASVAKYRVDSGSGFGAWTDLVLATISNAPAIGANPLYFCSAPFNSGDVNDQFSWAAHFHRITMFQDSV